MRLALGQIDVYWEDKERNKEKCEQFISKAKEEKADIVIFPEMTLTGFSQNVEKIGEVDLDTVQWFRNQSIKHSIYTCFGYVEKDNLKGKNKLAVISPEGKEVCSYTKIHPFSYGGEDKFYHKGEDISLFNIMENYIAPLICYDLRFPELFQAVSKKAELVIIIANWPKSRREAWMTLLKARAIENQCYIAGVNRVGYGDGLEYSGDSMIISPKGEILASSNEKEELIICDIDMSQVEKVRRRFPFKRDRREELYKEMFDKYKL
ncbi:carbon-nitrogen family hydrolase [Clostridium bovifaecis]|uniref:Carbon-nitrogen family hydrolase n=1 Tax=Clostridium bovifaecis TaxID=2184719 RepID=A0A6I6ET66_9CLOT|nr:carbon-nitrogen family hydrolase [Clostridium bovifaecis]